MFNFRAFSSALVILLLTPLSAHAVSLTLSGSSAELQMDNTQAVYASDSNGVPVLITEIGTVSEVDKGFATALICVVET